MKFSTYLSALLVALVLVGCQRNDETRVEDDYAADEEFAAPDGADAQQPYRNADSAPLSVADVDRWQRGMEAELAAVRESGTALARAETADDTLNAMMGANESGTLQAGARAAGVNPERYRFIRQNLSNAVKNLSPLEQEMDVSQMPPAMIEQLEQGRQASLDRMGDVLPSDVLDALRARAEELRRQDVTLTQERLRAAGIGT